MNIGIVTTWYERGASYVSRIYLDCLTSYKHNVFIYERGEKCNLKNDKNWSNFSITKEKKFIDGNITKRRFFRWIKCNKLDCVFFNEQHNFLIVAKTKKKFKNLLIGSYVDYYTENTIPYFNLFDFVICNTHRHYETMTHHPQKYFIKWGTEVNIFKQSESPNRQLTFFHSVGRSFRKGTDLLLNAFIKGKLYKKSKLIIHTQIPINNFTNKSIEELKKNNIEIINCTVTKPGLYHLGDVYVYPTKLDGLGLTMYEALACGLPVITTNYAPMNEIINNNCGKLVKIDYIYCRNDGYYYPMCVCDEKDLIKKMEFYITNKNKIAVFKKNARRYACKSLNILDRYEQINNAFTLSKIRKLDEILYKKIIYDFQNPIIKAIKCYSDSNIYLSKIKTLLKKRFGK